MFHVKKIKKKRRAEQKKMHAVGVEQVRGGGKPVGGLSFGRVKIQIYKKIHKAAKKKPKTNKMKPIDFGRKMFLKREKRGAEKGKKRQTQ